MMCACIHPHPTSTCVFITNVFILAFHYFLLSISYTHNEGFRCLAQGHFNTFPSSVRGRLMSYSCLLTPGNFIQIVYKIKIMDTIRNTETTRCPGKQTALFFKQIPSTVHYPLQGTTIRHSHGEMRPLKAYGSTTSQLVNNTQVLTCIMTALLHSQIHSELQSSPRVWINCNPSF